MIILVGTNGNLAKSILRTYPHKLIHTIKREEFIKWGQEDGLLSIDNYFSAAKILPTIIINATGIIDKSVSQFLMQRINVDLPHNLLRFGEINETKIVTFGSVMENFANIVQGNKYLTTKNNLFQIVNQPKFRTNSLHIQIHTWYGGDSIHKSMFLGEILHAIKTKTEFFMTSGMQIREYHHISDDTKVVNSLLAQDKSGVHQISHGKGLSLRFIAESIFSHYNLNKLLKLGAIADPLVEIFHPIFEPSNFLEGFEFRSTIPALLDYTDDIIKKD